MVAEAPAAADRSEKSVVKDNAVVRDNASALSVQTHSDMQNFAQLTGANATKPDVVQAGHINFANVPDVYGLNPEIASPLKPGGVTAADARVGTPGQPTDGSKDKPKTLSDTPTVDETAIKASKDRLTDVTRNMTPEQSAEFKKNMDDLEHRIPPVSADQINKIYDSTTKLLQDPEHTSQLSQAERTKLAAGILDNAAHPHDIDQGFHNTCNVTTLDERLNTTNPAEAARIVAEVGLTGQYKSKDGQIIKLDPKSLHPDGEARLDAKDPRADGARNYASQIFDMTTINDYWQHQNPPLYYSQTRPDGQSDTGERLTRNGFNGPEVIGPDGKPMRQPALGTEALGQIGRNLGMDGNFIISNTEYDGTRSADGVTKVGSYQDFEKALSTGDMPKVIFLNSGDKLFTGTDGNGGAGGGHVVTVSDYQAGPPPRVFMSNQWGSGNDKWVNVSDLYNATLPGGSGNRVDDQGKTRDQGGTVPPADQGGTQPGWSRKDEVWRDPAYQQWKDNLSHDPKLDQDKPKDNKFDPNTLIAPLRSQLEQLRNDPSASADRINAIEAEIKALQNSR